MNRDQLNALRSIGKALGNADKTMRDQSPKCPVCGKPTAGIIPAGKTAEDVGICTIHTESYLIDEYNSHQSNTLRKSNF